MPTRLDLMRQARLDHLQALKQAGIDPYPSLARRTHTAAQANQKDDLEVTVVGRIMAWRGHGKLQFIDLKDATGKIQLVFQADHLGEVFKKLKLLDPGDYLQASGTTFTTQAGERSVQVKAFNLLTKSLRPLPTSWQGLTDVEARYRQRYVDLLLNPEVRQIFLTRSRIITLMRTFFDRQGFLEVETPVLQPIYGGATAKPFITRHNALDTDLYLRIADELYLKRLIVGGFEKVYEIGHDFRNEGLSHAHSPEFTQIEFYWAYANYQMLMEFTEALVVYLLKEIKGKLEIEYKGVLYNFTPPWERLSYQAAILKHTGIDINLVNTEASLNHAIRQQNLKLDRHGVVGYGALLDTLYKKAVRPKLTGPLFLYDYPYVMKPLAKRQADNPELTGNFQLLIAGEEYVNAYNELNDPLDQRARWKEEAELAAAGLAEHQIMDEDYLRALEYGMPPTAGWGMGIDRLTMLLTDQPTIKDVILFPTLKPEVFKSDVKDLGSKPTHDPGSDNYDYADRKIVCIVDESLPPGKIANAIGHLSFAAGHQADADWFGRPQLLDADQQYHPGISRYPVIVLKATLDQIKKLRSEALKADLQVRDFPKAMFSTAHDNELASKLARQKSGDIIYQALLITGPSPAIDPLTRDLEVLR